MSGFKTFSAFSILPASDLNTYMVQHSFVLKTSDQSTTSSTYQNDTQLVLPLSANTNYWFDAFIGVLSVTGNRFKVKWSVPSGATMMWLSSHLLSNAEEGTVHMKMETESTELNASGNPTTGTIIPMRGVVKCGGTSGNLQLQWASVFGGDSSTVKASSLLRMVRLQ